MKLRVVVIGLSLMLLTPILMTAIATKLLERLGNEAAYEADSLYNMNNFREAARKYEEAYNYFLRAEAEDNIPLRDKVDQMLTNMQTAFYQGKDFENAIRIINKRLELEPKNEVYARQIAQIYERDLNNPQKAIETLERFDNSQPNFVVRRTLGRLYTAIEDDANALHWYQKAIHLEQDPDIHKNITYLQDRIKHNKNEIKADKEALVKTDDYNLRKTRWGMTINQVKDSETVDMIMETEDTLLFQTIVLSKNVALGYIFIDNKLVRAKYILTDTHTNRNNYIHDYNDFKETLTRIYGKPNEENINWRNHLYKDDIEQWGFAISLGQLIYYSSWDTKDTEIVLILRGNNYEISCIIEYSSKNLKHFERDARDKEAVNAF